MVSRINICGIKAVKIGYQLYNRDDVVEIFIFSFDSLIAKKRKNLKHVKDLHVQINITALKLCCSLRYTSLHVSIKHIQSEQQKLSHAVFSFLIKPSNLQARYN